MEVSFTEPFEYWYQAEVVSVHDGDTIALKIDMGKRIFAIDSIRLLGINAPELSQAGGKEARDYLRSLCPPGLQLRVQTFKNKKDKYGRWLGKVYISSPYPQDKRALEINQHMIDSGHAKFLAE